MAVRQYVGARYVPKFYQNTQNPLRSDWEANRAYEALTIVQYNNSSYTSKIPVPAGIGNPADNPTYWVNTGDYNAQVEQYRQVTEGVNTGLKEEITNRENADTEINENVEKVQAQADKTDAKLNKLFLLFEDFGAVGDGVTDDSDAIQNTFNAAGESGLEIKGLNKRYLVTKDLNIPKGVGLKGNLSDKTEIYATEPVALNVTGGADNSYNGYIENVYFTLVGINFGNTTDDYGNGYTVRNCRFIGIGGGPEYTAITLHNNCWNMLFENIYFRVCANCILCNFTDAVNSGARIILDNITGSDSTNGLVVNGHTADGSDIKLNNWNLEHMAYSILCDANSFGNTIYAYNGHCESNTGGLAKTEGASIFINGGWFYVANTATLATATNQGIIDISHARLNAQWSKYYSGKVTIGEGVITSLNNQLNIGNPNGAYRVPLESYYINKTLTEAFSTNVNNTNTIMNLDGLLWIGGGGGSRKAITISYAGNSVSILPSGAIINVGGFIHIHLFIWHRSISGYYIMNETMYPLSKQFTAGEGTNVLTITDTDNSNAAQIIGNLNVQVNYTYPDHFKY